MTMIIITFFSHCNCRWRSVEMESTTTATAASCAAVVLTSRRTTSSATRLEASLWTTVPSPRSVAWGSYGLWQFGKNYLPFSRPWWVDHQWKMKTFNWGFWKLVNFGFCPTEKPIISWLGEEKKICAGFLLIFRSQQKTQLDWLIAGLQLINGLSFFRSLGLSVFSSLMDCLSSGR